MPAGRTSRENYLLGKFLASTFLASTFTYKRCPQILSTPGNHASPKFSDSQWINACILAHKCSISTWLHETSYKILTNWYTTPSKLKKWFPRTSFWDVVRLMAPSCTYEGIFPWKPLFGKKYVNGLSKLLTQIPLLPLPVTYYISLITLWNTISILWLVIYWIQQRL